MSKADIYQPVDLAPLTRASYASVCQEVLKRVNLTELQWRHHGLGMLQAEISESLRVHIWHPKLVRLATAPFRDVHDHRFTLLSYVAFGSVTDVPYTIVPHDYGADGEGPLGWDHYPTADVHEILHAKEQENVRKGCSTATLGRRIGPAYVAQEEARTYKAGSVYAIRRRNFHTTRVTDLAITVVHRSDFDDKMARVLSQPGDAFVPTAIVQENNATVALRMQVLGEAHRAAL